MFLELYIWAKCQRGVKALPKIWITFKGFTLLDSIKIVLNLGKMSKRGGGVVGLGPAKNIGALFLNF
jgi:hypothetical protein